MALSTDTVANDVITFPSFEFDAEIIRLNAFKMKRFQVTAIGIILLRSRARAKREDNIKYYGWLNQ